ncbi:MAG TPA: helix-turn-helix transcriptional regulator [Chloroflexi bacterium]|jgi:hypothetical protein|nr:helix-turn-helix transcriptional regulator [Chloroflexota bacterium]
MRDSEIQAMIDALRAIAERDNLNHQGLARQVGCSTGQLSMVFAGKRRPGIRFIRLVVRRYPEIRRLLASSLAQDEQPPSAPARPNGAQQGPERHAGRAR